MKELQIGTHYKKVYQSYDLFSRGRTPYKASRLHAIACVKCPFTIEFRKLPRFPRNSFLPRHSMGMKMMRTHWEGNHT